MQEAYVELTCPNCNKLWERDPNELGDAETPFECPDCGERAPLGEFARTTRDLEVIEEMEEL